MTAVRGPKIIWSDGHPGRWSTRQNLCEFDPRGNLTGHDGRTGTRPAVTCQIRRSATAVPVRRGSPQSGRQPPRKCRRAATIPLGRRPAPTRYGLIIGVPRRRAKCSRGGRRRADLMVIPRSMRWDPKPWPGSSAGSVSMPCMPRGRSTTSMSPSPMTVGSGISGGRRSARSPNVTNRVGPPSAAHPECVVTGRRTGARRSRYRSWSRPGGAAPRFATATTVLAGTTVSQEDAPLFGGIHGGRRPRSTSRAGLTSDRAPDEDCCRWVRQRCHRSFLISSSAPSAWLG